MSGSEIIDSAVTDAIAADAVVSGNERRRSNFSADVADGHCSNCGTPLKGPICHSCGQDSDTYHRPVWSLVLEALDGLFSFDGRFWRTIPPLMFRPGRITRHYLTGVRARYVQPFRLFIVASLAFFLVFSLDGLSMLGEDARPGEDDLAEAERALAEAQAENPEIAAQLAEVREAVDALEEDVRTRVDEDPQVALLERQRRRDAVELSMRQSLLPEDYPDAQTSDGSIRYGSENGGYLELNGFDWLPYSARVYLADRIANVIQDPDSWLRAVQVWTPRMIFFLLPIYALLLALMHFWKRGIYFYDHLVVSLHFHAFLFFLMTALILAGPLIGAFGVLVFILWSNFYLYRLHRRVYGHARFMSVMRVLVLDAVYFVVLIFALLTVMAFGVLFA